ncbi:hypothetical protein TIFTF001_056582 [Ficus carica]|uniref:Uncharacterized protein n=1 Tax=Ficus carica TaxID=3494 RepID=A0AA88JHS7_FICCA|nr:hypothetical protein TIFTF001_056579 [Ficus carica]GMN75211.1 hypothetical protein TIFTF001_056580 [Ficus carica]GMN75214.1 hypothetical protein TIFTF001_056581 [Ficus carica]GMN75216.1 hypothetical protein TIFTF001_056582 [Ficus carica]
MAWAGAGTRSTRAWLRTRPGIHAVLEWSGAGITGLGWQQIRGPELVHVEGTAGAGSWAARGLGLPSRAGITGLSWRTWREQLGLAAGLGCGLGCNGARRD